MFDKGGILITRHQSFLCPRLSVVPVRVSLTVGPRLKVPRFQNPYKSVINQYGRLTKLSSEFVEAISKHSPILKFVETSNWSSLGNYFEDRKEGNIGWDQQRVI